MKVIQVLNHFLPQQTAGTEVYAWALSKQLQKRNIDIKVLVPNYNTSSFEDYFYDSLAVHKYAEPSVVDRSLIMGFRTSDGLPNFIAYLQETQPDIVHFHEIAGSNGITLKHVQAAKSSGAKVIMTFHLAGYSCKTGTLVHKGSELCNGIIDLQKCSACNLDTRVKSIAAPFLVFASKFLYHCKIDTSVWHSRLGTALGIVPIIAKLRDDLQAVISACDRVVSITNWYSRVLLANGIDNQKICVIPQGLAFATKFQSLNNKTYNFPLRLMFLGRINNFKGLHLLLEALSSIDPEKVQLTIYGNSDDYVYETFLRNTTKQQTNIYWKGKLQYNDVVSTMQEHDVLCLCSTFSEMSPLVIQEAFAAHIPVLASNVYGNAEQIQHNHNGLLFQFNNVEDLRIQILRCINEPDLINDLSKNIKTPRSFDEVGDEYYKLYKSLLN